MNKPFEKTVFTVTRWWGFPKHNDPRLLILMLLIAFMVSCHFMFDIQIQVTELVMLCIVMVLLDHLLHYIFNGKSAPLFPLSIVITAMTLSVLLKGGELPWQVIWPAILTVIAKHIITYNGRHFFNPALLGIVLTIFFMPDAITPYHQVTWSGLWGAAAIVFLPITIILFKTTRRWLVVSFILIYFVSAFIQGIVLRSQMPFMAIFLEAISSPYWYLFAFFILSDPITTPNQLKSQIRMALFIVVFDAIFRQMSLAWSLYWAGASYFAYQFLTLHFKKVYAQYKEHQHIAYLSELALYLLPKILISSILVTSVGLLTFINVLPDYAQHKIAFKLVKQPMAQLGITSEASDIMNQLDPKLSHVGKWLLSIGDSVASADVNNDGLVDLYFTQALKASKDRGVLYLNQGNFKFQRFDMPDLDYIRSNPQNYGLMVGAIFLDIDNDLDQDLFLNVGYGKSMLMLNQLSETGKLDFLQSRQTHLANYATVASATALDLNSDGFLDLVATNPIQVKLDGYNSPTYLNPFHLPFPEYAEDRRMMKFFTESWYDSHNGGGVTLYLNKPNDPSKDEPIELVDVTSQWIKPEKNNRWSFGAAVGDLNNDGKTDLYIANDFGPDQFLINQTTHFSNVEGQILGQIGNDYNKGASVSISDLNNDNQLDVYVSGLHNQYLNQGSSVWLMPSGKRAENSYNWHNSANKLGLINQNRFSLGSAIGDIDLDGRNDVIQLNGNLSNKYDQYIQQGNQTCIDYWKENRSIWLSIKNEKKYADNWRDIRGRCIAPHEKNRFMLNMGDHFLDASDDIVQQEASESRGAALVDLNNDGRLDVVLTRQFDEPIIYQNTLNERIQPPSWIGIDLVGNGKTCNTNAAGSVVKIDEHQSPNGPQMKEIQISNGMSAQNDHRALFAVKSTLTEVMIQVKWCNTDKNEDVFVLKPNQYHKLEQPAYIR